MPNLQLRPSAAGKWANCPGSVLAELDRPGGNTPAADEGTVAHWIAAKILKDGGLPEIGSEWEVVDREVLPVLYDSGLPTIIFTAEMLETVQRYTDEIDTSVSTFVEKRIDATFLGENGGGTPDCYQISKGVLTVHDLKYGFNPVDAKDNLQLLTYAYILDKYHGNTFTGFKLVIHQPRLGVMDAYEYTRETIAPLWGKILSSAARSLSGETERTAGNHCHKHYCKAMAVCTEYQAYALEDLPDVAEGLSNVDIGQKLSKLESIRKWCDAIEAEAYALAVEKGEKIPGFKVVAGRGGNRAWRDEAEAEAAMKSLRLKSDQMYSYKVVSPTQAEKLLKDGTLTEKRWLKLKELITRSAGKPQLVPDSDKRPEIEVINDLDLL